MRKRARKRSFGDKDLLQKLAPVLGGGAKPPEVAGKERLLSPPAAGDSQLDGLPVSKRIALRVRSRLFTISLHL